MPLASKRRPARKTAKAASRKPNGTDAQSVVAELKRRGTKATRDGMARFAIPSDKAFGVTVGALKQMAKEIGRDHALANALWQTGWYEARMLAAFVDEPSEVTPTQMDRWCRDFDNWAICDTVCFALFDRTPFAWAKVAQWAKRTHEFQKRTAFALLWSLTAHDKTAADAKFLEGLRLIEGAASDERNFVKKAVNMALRSIGKRNKKLHVAAIAVAQKLSRSSNASAKWVGTDAMRELTSPAVVRRLS
jgi:3-methyladenine DNA glycosylase AlkD